MESSYLPLEKLEHISFLVFEHVLPGAGMLWHAF